MAHLGNCRSSHSFLHYFSTTILKCVSYLAEAAAVAEIPSTLEEAQENKAQCDDQSEGGFVEVTNQPRIGLDFNRYVSLLQECTNLKSLREIHTQMHITGRTQNNMFLCNKLVTAYANYGSLVDARLVFDCMPKRNLVSWNVLIGGYAKDGGFDETLRVYGKMHRAGVQPDNFTFPFLLKACTSLSALKEGKEIHQRIIRSGLESDVFVATGLVDMYAKCRSIEDARQVFEKMPERDLVSWTAMIGAYAQQGYADQALELFHEMQLLGMDSDEITLVSVLSACTHVGALQQGKWIHDCVVRRGFDGDVLVASALIDMYCKCGSTELARQVFDKMLKRDVVSWSAIIAGYGLHGQSEDALALFDQMLQSGIRPDHITFVSVLSACSHAGLVAKGWEYFDCMSRDYGIIPGVKHYTCMVDLLGRAGHLDEAHEFIKKMPLEPDAGVWGALLGASRIHSNTELGERVAERLFEIEPRNPGYYVLLSNIYAAKGRWHDSVKVRTMMMDLGLRKPPGCSWIELNNKVHAFRVGDRSHPQSKQIYELLETLGEQMQGAGYVADTNFVLHDVEEEVKENILGSHSEKLAIAFGLLNTKPGSPIRITKNLRVCGDCHNASKYISRIVSREIIMRDASRFHHFKNGSCSCRDYW
jgi:pentatricopeptide repeat protein